METARPLPAYLALALSMMMVGANVPLGKYLTTQLPIGWIGVVRCGSAVLPLGILCAWELRRTRLPALRAIAGIAALGISGVFLYPCFLLLGLRTTSAFGAGAITATLPAIVALLSTLFLHERFDHRILGAVLCAAFAIAALELAAAGGAIELGSNGNLLVLIAVFAEAVYVILARGLAQAATPSQMALIANLSGLAAFALLLLVTGEKPPIAPVTAWVGAAAFGITSSVLALLLWFWAVARVSASKAGVFTVFLPLTAAVIAIAILGERPNAWALCGIAAAIIAILLATTSDGSKRLPLP